MTVARVRKVYSALDIGSSKVSAIIAGLTDDDRLVVLGSGQRESEGVRRGYIADIERAELAIRNAVEQAERIAGVNVEDIWISCSSAGLRGAIASAEIEIGGDRIEDDDIDHLLAAANANIDPGGSVVLHAHPAHYTLDGLTGVARPRGLHADRLAVDVHVVLADGAPIRNIDLGVRAAHLDVAGMVAAPIAAGHACLTPEEKELGVALVEIGAEITNVSLYAAGMLVALSTIQMGSADITDAVASAFGLRRAQAERIKCKYGSAMSSPQDHRDMIDLDSEGDGSDHAGRITRAELIAVIGQPLGRLIGEIGKKLRALGFQGNAGGQVVLTGGGADMRCLADHAQVALGHSVRIGKPRGLLGLPEAHMRPAFATPAGTILHAAFGPEDVRDVAARFYTVDGQPGTALISRVYRAFRSYF